jgi:D-sedoheptulose 7-phosphate isomerase
VDWQGRLGTEAFIGKKILRAQDRLSEHFNEHSRVVLDSVAVLMEALETHARWVSETLVSGGRLFFCGNGGSAADAQHLAAEYVVRFERNRRGLSAMALTTDTAVLTAVGNDFGYEQIFARQIEALSSKGDLLILLSSSGLSPNLVTAAQQARTLDVRTIGLLGRGGGSLRDEVDLPIVVPTDSIARAQELHLLIGHAVCDVVDAALGEV